MWKAKRETTVLTPSFRECWWGNAREGCNQDDGDGEGEVMGCDAVCSSWRWCGRGDAPRCRVYMQLSAQTAAKTTAGASSDKRRSGRWETVGMKIAAEKKMPTVSFLGKTALVCQAGVDDQEPSCEQTAQQSVDAQSCGRQHLRCERSQRDAAARAMKLMKTRR